MNKRFVLSILLLILMGANTPAGIPEGLKFKKIKKEIPVAYRSDLKLGLRYLKKEQAYQAKKIFEKLVRQSPDFYIFWGYGRTEWALGNYKNARSLYFKALEKDSSNYHFLKDYAALSAEIVLDWGVIQRLATALYRIEPDDFALTFVIDKLTGTEDSKKAVLFFQRLKEEFPDNGNIDVYHAILQSNLGADSVAVALATRAWHSTENPFQLRMLAYILANNDSYLQAAQVCEKLSRIASRSADTYDAWGHLEYQQGHYENAAIHYQKALHHDYRLRYLVLLAQIYHFHLNDPGKAVYYCKAALQIDRRQVDAYFILAESSRKSGKMEKALHYSQKQIALLPEHPQPLYYHGKLLFEMNRFQAAIEYLEKAVSRSPNVQRYRLILAKAYAGAGLIDKARATYANFLHESVDNLWSEEENLKEAPAESR